jgi:hypothetical protein
LTRERERRRTMQRTGDRAPPGAAQHAGHRDRALPAAQHTTTVGHGRYGDE